MVCPGCGMDSRDPNICEWCFNKLTAPGQPPVATAARDLTQPVSTPIDLTQPIPASLDTTQAIHHRVALTGEIVVSAPVAPLPPQQVQPPVYGQPTTPRSWQGLPAQAVGPQLAQQYADSGRSSASQRWEKCLAIALPILLASVWIVHLNPTSIAWVIVADMFLIALAMGATAAIGSYDDAYLDVGSVLVVSILFGPVIGLVVYAIVGALKQEFNTAILALLGSHLIIRFIVMLAFPMSAGVFTVIPGWMLLSAGGLLSVCATFAGWILSSFLRPLNE